MSSSLNNIKALLKSSFDIIAPGSILDPEKQALIEEINTLRQQILDLSQTYLTINKVL